MSETSRFYLTTAIDYPNSRPHIGTAFEKLGADAQARYRRMEGFEVFFLMGNDENTVKVAKKAEELGRDPKEYCDDMAQQFKEVWQALDISYDDFIQTSDPRHHEACRQFIQTVYDNGHIYKGVYEGLYCEGCESFKTERDLVDGLCKDHGAPPIKREEECYYFALSKFREQLLDFYDKNPEFIQPESRRNEIVALVQSELLDVNITRSGETWGIKVPFDEDYTIFVWFDALLNYITGIGYGQDEEQFNQWWPADIHFIGKDITRFHCALWPAMCFAAGIEPPRMVFGHGFVYLRDEKMAKSRGNVIDAMEPVTKSSSEAFRYYFLSQCPFPDDGSFTWERFQEVYNADLANNLGNLYSRVIRLIAKNYEGHLPETANLEPGVVYTEKTIQEVVEQIQRHMDRCQYNQALECIWRFILDPANRYAEKHEPWKLVKTDLEAAKRVLFDMTEQLRAASILLKPFLPRISETIYQSFNFPKSWEEVRYEDVFVYPSQGEDLRILAELEGGKVKPLLPRITEDLSEL